MTDTQTDERTDRPRSPRRMDNGKDHRSGRWSHSQTRMAQGVPFSVGLLKSCSVYVLQGDYEHWMYKRSRNQRRSFSLRLPNEAICAERATPESAQGCVSWFQPLQRAWGLIASTETEYLSFMSTLLDMPELDPVPPLGRRAVVKAEAEPTSDQKGLQLIAQAPWLTP